MFFPAFAFMFQETTFLHPDKMGNLDSYGELKELTMDSLKNDCYINQAMKIYCYFNIVDLKRKKIECTNLNFLSCLMSIRPQRVKKPRIANKKVKKR